MKGVLSYTDEELVSADFIHNVPLGDLALEDRPDDVSAVRRGGRSLGWWCF